MQQTIPIAIVGALIFDNQDRVFLMRSSGKFGEQWIVPGGKVEFGETMADGLKREIREETNLELVGINFKGVRELIQPNRHFIFLEFTAKATNCDEVILNSESTEYGWFGKAQLNKVNIAEPTLELITQWWE